MTTTPTSFAAALREFTPQELTTLLSLRADLVAYVSSTRDATTLNALATRASLEASVSRCLKTLNLPQIQLLEVCVALYSGQAIAPATLAQACDEPLETIAPHLQHLRNLGLVWGTPNLHPVRGLLQAMPNPVNLGPSLKAAHAKDPTGLAQATANVPLTRQALAECSDAVQAACERLAWHNPVATMSRNHDITNLCNSGHLYLAHSSRDGQGRDRLHIVMPREIALEIRAPYVRHGLSLAAPQPEIDGAATRELTDTNPAFEIVRNLNQLIDWDENPPATLRHGGLPVRELRRLANLWERPEPDTITLAHTAMLAGYLAHDGSEWSLTHEYFDAALQPETARWAELAQVWLDSPHHASLAGRAEPDPAQRPLAPDLTYPAIATLRRMILAASASGVPHEKREEYLAWHHPHAIANLPDSVAILGAEICAEAATLGIMTSTFAITPWGLSLLNDGETEAAAALNSAAPPPVDEIFLQSDLTAVVPGRPSAKLQPILEWVTVESRGGAQVLRFTPESLQRGIARGQSPAALLEILRSASPTGVPQPLEYLIDDAARKSGQIRLGRATTYLRADAGLLDEILAQRTAGALMSHRIAPTVLVTSVDTAHCVTLLREMGFAPGIEGPDGQILHVNAARTRPAPTRAALSMKRSRTPTAGTAPDLAQLANALLAATPTAAPLTVNETLQQAITSGTNALVEIVDGRGTTSRRTIKPMWLDAGKVTARDAETDDVFTVAIHRVLLAGSES